MSTNKLTLRRTKAIVKHSNPPRRLATKNQQEEEKPII
jgi:hypothetical protein